MLFTRGLSEDLHSDAMLEHPRDLSEAIRAARIWLSGTQRSTIEIKTVNSDSLARRMSRSRYRRTNDRRSGDQS